MNEHSRLSDEQITDLLRRRSARRVPEALEAAVLESLASEREVHPIRAARRSRTRPMVLLAAAALLLVGGAFAAGSGLLRLPTVVPPVPAPSVVAVATASPEVTSPSPSASAAPSASPIPVAGPGGAWIATGTMVTPRYGFTAVRLLDGRVLVVGGSTTPESYLTSAELYDPASGTWSATGNTVSGADLDTATLLRDGKVLVVGGSRAQLYDAASGTWSATGKPPSGDGLAVATLLRDGRVLVVGVGGGAELYDPDSGTWTATGRMITPRYNTTATLLPDGRVLVAGGDVIPDKATNSAELYDPDTGSWAATTNLQTTAGVPGYGFDAIKALLLRDGTVLVVRPSGAELYHPATGSWTAIGDIARPGTVYQSATLLSDGRVLLAGSFDGTEAPRTAAELYDPSTAAWTTTGSMLREHNGVPATPLLDGTVLVAGGWVCQEGSESCPTGATGSAELYIPAGVSPPPGLGPVPSTIPAPTPTPTPIPTPFPTTAGPVPADARSWKVTVVNKNSEPATLFLAEEGENGIGQLCGSVTPNVVPAGVTERVTFLLPPKRVKSCWIWVEAVPGGAGSLFQTSDAPLAGHFLIMAGGEEGAQGGWVSP